VHKRVLLPITGVPVLSIFCIASSSAQTAPVPANDPPSAPVPAAPVPTDTKSPVPAYPPYQQQQTPGTTVPPATPAGPPVVAPAQPTPESPVQAYVPYGVPDEDRRKSHDGSPYIPVDSWVYPAMDRLYSLGFADTMFLGMRPYTRQSLAHILAETHDDVADSDDDNAKEILAAVEHYLQDEPMDGITPRGTVYGTETAYTRLLGISGQTLNDSYHLGQTIVNDYGRPYQPGFNAIAGFSELAEQGRFSFYFRGEYQHAPGAAGYSQTLSAALSQGGDPANPFQYVAGDQIVFSGYNLHQATIPTGPIAAANPFRIEEATLSFHLLGHEISGGKSDAWLGPAFGSSMAWSNNAEDIYSFRINRVEPLHIPLFSSLFGPVRYDFFYGSLKGHSQPNSPYVHSESISVRPTVNSEIAVQRTVIFGGEGHEPVTFHTFARSFFSLQDTENNPAAKGSAQDPGARFSDFSFSWRLPFVRKYATLVLDSICHDDVSPISAPRRAAYRTGVYLSQIPGARKFDFRVEAVTTDPGVSRSVGGQFQYFETIERQGYTNKGFLMGDWIGREAKGGQAWLTYHLSGDEWVQLEYLNKKTEKDFIPGAYNPATATYGPGGTTQNSFKVDVVKRFHHDDVELNAWYQHEGWKAPIYLSGLQTNQSFAAGVTFYPALKHK
jgi:hypothetical protein